DITVVSTPAPKSSMAVPLRRAYGKARLVSGERVLLAEYHSLFIFSTMGASGSGEPSTSPVLDENRLDVFQFTIASVKMV
ncbi:MAG: hypothetical protein ACRCTX_02440, partial [Afipia sp.]